jgi:phage shock protein C
MKKQNTSLVRSRSDRMIAGVCAGVAEYLGWPVLRVRIAFVVLSALSAAFPGILVYLLLWLVMPTEARERRSFRIDDPGSR